MMGMPAYVKENLKNAQLILESLKQDHEQALKTLDAFTQNHDVNTDASTTSDPDRVYNQEKLPLIKSALNQIQNGLDDSEVLVTFAKYVECLEAENMKLNLHNQRLCEETGWLRDELKYTQTKLGENEALLAQALVEKRHLEFMLELRKYEEPVNGVTEDDRAIFEKSLAPGTSIHPTMAASVLGLTSTPNSYRTTTDWGPVRRQNGSFPVAMSPMDSSQNWSTSTQFMHSSLLQGDLGSVLCSQSFHPSLMAGTGQRESRNSFSLATIPPRLRTIHQIVMQYTGQGKHEVAASLCLQAIADLERTGGHDQAEVAVLLNVLALVYRDQGKYNEAADLLQDVVSIRERALGPNHPSVAAALNNLAVLYAKAARFKDAEPLCRRALAIREKLLGPNHPDVAKQLNNLALLCQSQGRFEEVELSFRKALDIYLKQHKPSSPTVLRAKNNLASALLKRGNLDDAESLLKAVLTPIRPPPCLNSTSDMQTTTTTDVDSAVFSLSSLGSSGFLSVPGAPFEPNGHSGPKDRVVPLWLLIEQAAKEGRTQLARLAKFDLAAWATEARVELPIVLSALRNLAIVYQRQGQQPLACLLRHWIQSVTTGANPSCTASIPLPSSSAVPASPLAPTDSPKPELIKELSQSFHASCSSPVATPKFS